MAKGLSVDGGKSFLSDLLPAGGGTPPWMDFSQEVAKLSGNQTALDFITGIKGASEFVIRVPKWPIGDMYCDGIIRTDHSSRVRATTYPVQTGVRMTDHAIVEPSELSIEVMFNDSANDNLLSAAMSGGMGSAIAVAIKAYNVLKAMQYSNVGELTAKPGGTLQVGEGRGVNAWQMLKAMQISRVPIDVETRLETYHNMIIEELSAPDDVKTYHALRCTVRLVQIIFANVSEEKVSARPAASSGPSASGQQPVNTQPPNETALKSGMGAFGIGGG